MLEKCLHGNTQSPNESFSNCIWQQMPKTTSVGFQTLQVSVVDGVLCFHNGVTE
jgi:hypothetical protein